MTLACLNAFKNTPLDKDGLKSCAKTKAMLAGHNFTILVDMSSKLQLCLPFTTTCHSLSVKNEPIYLRTLASKA